MGCIRLLPGSHVIGQRPHKDTSTPGNLLSRGQTIEHRLDYTKFVLMPLRAGQISLHHTHIVHSSEPNRTDQRRIGIGVSYIPPHCRLVNDVRVTAALVRGRDEYGHFDLERRPAATSMHGGRGARRRASVAFESKAAGLGFTPPIGRRRHLIRCVWVWSWFLTVESPPALSRSGSCDAGGQRSGLSPASRRRWWRGGPRRETRSRPARWSDAAECPTARRPPGASTGGSARSWRRATPS